MMPGISLELNDLYFAISDDENQRSGMLWIMSCISNIYIYVAERLEALVWRLSQPGFDLSCGKILSSHTDEFW